MNTLQKQVGSWRSWINHVFPEREDATTAGLCSYIFPSNAFELGGPGTAKSLHARTINQMWGGAKFMFRQLHPGTVPENLVGPISMKGIQNDVFEHKTTGYLPDCHGLLLDELGRSGLIAQDFLLLLINEREFQQGSQTVKLPLISVIATSNSVPEQDQHQAALYDRLLLRCKVDYLVDGTNWRNMLGWGRRTVPQAPPQVPLSELLDNIHPQVESMEITPEAQDAIEEVKLRLRTENIIVSDRTWAHTCADTDIFGRQVKSAVKAAAWMNGKSRVEKEDLAEVLYLTLWSDPKDIPTVNKAVSQVCAPLDQVAQGLLNRAEQRYAEIKILPGVKPNATAKEKEQAEEAMLAIFQALKPLRAEVRGHLNGRDPNSPVMRKVVAADNALRTMLQELASRLDLGVIQ